MAKADREVKLIVRHADGHDARGLAAWREVAYDRVVGVRVRPGGVLSFVVITDHRRTRVMFAAGAWMIAEQHEVG